MRATEKWSSDLWSSLVGSRRRRLYRPKQKYALLWQPQTNYAAQAWYYSIHVWLLGRSSCSSPSTSKDLHDRPHSLDLLKILRQFALSRFWREKFLPPRASQCYKTFYGGDNLDNLHTVWPDWTIFEKSRQINLLQNKPKWSTTFWAILKTSLLCKNCIGYFLGNFWKKLGYFFLQHLATLPTHELILIFLSLACTGTTRLSTTQWPIL